MLYRPATLLLSAALLSPGARLYPDAPPAIDNHAATAPEPVSLVIRKQVAEVRVVFNVDESHKPVNQLTREQFTVFEDGQPVPAFTSFDRDSDLPLYIGLLVDRSDSMHQGFSAEQLAARRFLERVMRPDLDAVFLMDFSASTSVLELTSGNLQPISGRVTSLKTGGLTALYDVLISAAAAMTHNPEGKPARRVIILLSDGDDNYSRSSLPEAVEAAQRANIMIYAITAHNPRYVLRGDAVLKRLAATTGGRDFILKNFGAADAAFAQIEDDLRTQYSITFHPRAANRCGYHRLQVRPQNGKLQIRARDGYFACD